MSILTDTLRSKRDGEGQKPPAESRRPLNGQAHAIYRFVRRLSERIATLEEQVSTLRRDLNRVDRKVYRDAEGIPEVPKDVKEGELRW